MELSSFLRWEVCPVCTHQAVAALPVALHWHHTLSYTLGSWFALLCSLTPPIHRDLSPSLQRGCHEQEGTWPPSGGEVLCTGSFTSLPGLAISCQVTVPKLCKRLLVWRQKCSRAALKIWSAHSCLASLPQNTGWSTGSLCRCHLPLVQNTAAIAVSWTAALQGSCFLSGSLLAFLSAGRNFQFGNGAATVG